MLEEVLEGECPRRLSSALDYHLGSTQVAVLSLHSEGSNLIFSGLPSFFG